MELMAFAFPHDSESPTFIAEFPRILTEVANTFSVEFYTNDNRRFYSITRWDEHQRNERRASSRLPGPNDSESAPDKEFYGNQGFSDDRHGISVHSDGNTATGTGEQGNRGTGEQGINIPAKQVSRSPAYSEEFESFWKTYPSFRRKEKPKAWAEWKKAIKRASPNQIINGLQTYLTGDVTYAPYPAKWLKADSWNDGPDISQRIQSSRIVTRTQKAQAEWDNDRRILAQLEAEEASQRRNEGGNHAIEDRRLEAHDSHQTP
jgi:hypothetical protein